MVFKARMAILATVTLGVLLSCPVALATFPGENGKIAFSRDGDIWIMDPDGSNQEQLTSGPAADSDPKWAPDGSAIAFGRVNDGHNRVLIYDLVGGLHRLGDLKAGFATWAPSGLRLLVVSVGSNFDPPPLAVVSLDGSIVWTIPGTGYMYDPDWAPRGDRIAVTQGDVATEILTIEPDGTNQQVVSPVPQDLDIFNEHASWSPDAGQIAFEHNPESHCTEISPGQFECKNNAQIYTVEADGNGPTELTAYDPNRTDEDPGWSPDGSQIAFARYDFSGPSPVNPTIQLMDTDGGNVHEIASGAGPEWQPLVAPRTSHRPRILGVPRSGQELVAKPGSWFGTPDLSFTYQWRRCSSGPCEDIAGATDPTYVLTDDDVFRTVSLSVTATNDQGESLASSLATDTVGRVAVGTDGDDRLHGTPGSDLLRGRGGDDGLGGSDGNDSLFGASGDDRLHGGFGSDYLVGGPGADRILGANERQYSSVGDRIDEVRGGDGPDWIYVRDALRDVVDCGPGHDVVLADSHDDVHGDCEVVKIG